MYSFKWLSNVLTEHFSSHILWTFNVLTYTFEISKHLLECIVGLQVLDVNFT